MQIFFSASSLPGAGFYQAGILPAYKIIWLAVVQALIRTARNNYIEQKHYFCEHTRAVQERIIKYTKY